MSAHLAPAARIFERFSPRIRPDYRPYLANNLKFLLPQAALKEGKIASRFVPAFVDQFRDVSDLTGEAQKIALELKDLGVIGELPERRDMSSEELYRALVWNEMVAGEGESHREAANRLNALQELELKLGIDPEVNRQIATRCLREALGFSGVRVYSVDLEKKTWFHRYSEGEEGVSRFNEPKTPPDDSEKAYLTRLLNGEVSQEEILRAREERKYEWYQNGEWSYLYISDRSRCDFVEAAQLRKDEEGDAEQMRRGYGRGGARKILYLVFGKAGDPTTEVYLVTNWADHTALFSEINQDVELLRTFAASLARSRNLAAAYRELEKLSIVDELTGVYNRRYFNRMIEAEFIRAKRQGHPLSLLMIDIDHFKKLNDVYGHQFGDRVLKAVAKAIEKTARDKIDIVARYGGEEFAAILPDTNKEGSEASGIAERVRREIEKTVFEHEGNPVSLTVSIGIASFPKNSDSVGDLIFTADQALYRAKDAGRNSIVSA
ncbi:hypothetical protein A2625_03720 [candidate division WOR-1 bacterium RIFCSPHIGHO2_01_FULL_53_15]|uniref:GGDEF domain-containing protein n=1 Tax=candidate division WOR-1 bacterium RIFCSPHIGHO2_01_FULL_53_15 TaxID=1802564 RepID=A0A1F4Q041_UNCSA|nr:MAG: hypothetical protein A2625_03720 [candidate division WOR-1 bacterium RIFCSPHIGHO2_01_FULL_53_15]OGC12878.1 MAG: hypothetical protein A3D23_04750 [candidate division WOR-1 bacterium RIFCSPHIGHO2_02_FULL_53_26]